MAKASISKRPALYTLVLNMNEDETLVLRALAGQITGSNAFPVSRDEAVALMLKIEDAFASQLSSGT